MSKHKPTAGALRAARAIATAVADGCSTPETFADLIDAESGLLELLEVGIALDTFEMANHFTPYALSGDPLLDAWRRSIVVRNQRALAMVQRGTDQSIPAAPTAA